MNVIQSLRPSQTIMKIVFVIIEFTLCVSVSSQLTFGGQGQKCILPEGSVGVCAKLANCPQVANIFRVAEKQSALQYIKFIHQSCDTYIANGDPVVCCSIDKSSLAQQTLLLRTTEGSRNSFSPEKKTESTTTETPTMRQRALSATSTEHTSTQTTFDNETFYSTHKKAAVCFGLYPEPGVCVSVKDCPQFLKKLKKNPNDEAFKEFLRFAHEKCGSIGSNVCCQSSSNEDLRMKPNVTSVVLHSLPTPDGGCGYSPNSFKKVVGGETSKIGTWPWIALVGYNDDLSGSPFKCGGSLITNIHVITAAHCLRSDLTFVRLGEHDLTQEDETKHLDVNVTSSKAHPNYNRRNGHSDLAVLYLEKSVVFTKNILPICLPLTKKLQGKSYVNHMPFVAGWGKLIEGGKSAKILQQLQLPIIDNKVCQQQYRTKNRLLSENQFDDAVICAGILSGGKDTCQGDSGGPLMVPERFNNEFRFYLVGVVAYGIGCARVEVPGVYTSIQYFMGWINETINAI